MARRVLTRVPKFLVALATCVSLVVSFIIETHAAEIRMVAPNIPPHFDEHGNGRIGDVIRASLQRCGHSVSFVTVPFGRHWKTYEDDPSVDALATAEADQVFPGTSTKPFMHLQDGATVLRSSELAAMTGLNDLHGKRVVAFPNADKILAITDDVSKFASFKMRSGRFNQLRPLFAGRADAVLADGLITAHFISVLKNRAVTGTEPDIDPTLKVVFRKIFQPGPQRLYFRRAELAHDFDRCFKELLDAGDVERFADTYLSRYRDIVGDQYPTH